MAMNDTVLLDPCRRCKRVHPERQGRDGKPTRRAADGHPYDPGPEAFSDWPEPNLSTVTNGWVEEFHGVMARCPLCAAIVANRKLDMDFHERWHSEEMSA